MTRRTFTASSEPSRACLASTETRLPGLSAEALICFDPFQYLVFFEQMNLNSAANSFRDALNGDKDPKWVEVWCYIYLGKINDILGQRQRALAEYNKAVNTKDDTFGAQAEAQKWINAPFVKDQNNPGKAQGPN